MDGLFIAVASDPGSGEKIQAVLCGSSAPRAARQEAHKTDANGCISGQSGRIATEAVLFWIGDQACADWVEVDIGGDCLESGGGFFDQSAGEAFCPESAEAAGVSIEPAAEALFEFLHEGGDIAHAAGEGLADVRADGA